MESPAPALVLHHRAYTSPIATELGAKAGEVARKTRELLNPTAIDDAAFEIYSGGGKGGHDELKMHCTIKKIREYDFEFGTKHAERVFAALPTTLSLTPLSCLDRFGLNKKKMKKMGLTGEDYATLTSLNQLARVVETLCNAEMASCEDDLLSSYERAHADDLLQRLAARQALEVELSDWQLSELEVKEELRNVKMSTDLAGASYRARRVERDEKEIGGAPHEEVAALNAEVLRCRDEHALRTAQLNETEKKANYVSEGCRHRRLQLEQVRDARLVCEAREICEASAALTEACKDRFKRAKRVVAFALHEIHGLSGGANELSKWWNLSACPGAAHYTVENAVEALVRACRARETCLQMMEKVYVGNASADVLLESLGKRSLDTDAYQRALPLAKRREMLAALQASIAFGAVVEQEVEA